VGCSSFVVLMASIDTSPQVVDDQGLVDPQRF